VLDMLAYYTWDEPAGITALLTGPHSFARTSDLARIYDVPTWRGQGTPPTLPNGRGGLLTRAALLATGTADTRPIMRGVFIRRQLLCDELDPPPPSAALTQPIAARERSTRQAVEQLTEQPGSLCASCHATRINPLGFVLEGYDALGRIRSEQRVLNLQGSVLDTLPIDLEVTPYVTETDARKLDSPAQLAQRMLDSGKVEACLARHYFRFTFGRYEDLEQDGCALERLRARLQQTGQLREMLREAALLPEMTHRRFQ